MNNKIFIPILIAIIIIAAIAVVLVTQKSEPVAPPVVDNIQNQDEPEVITSDIDTSNWKTYRNEEIGFEFRYPSSWYILERQGSTDLYSQEPKEPYSVRNTLVDQYKIEFSHPSFEECGDKLDGYLERKSQGRIRNEKYISISDLSVYQHDHFLGETRLRLVCIRFDDNRTFNVAGKLDEDFLSVFDEIITTLRFEK